MSKIFAQLCEKRGITPDFLNPKYEHLSDPFPLPDMDKAIARIQVVPGNGNAAVCLFLRLR